MLDADPDFIDTTRVNFRAAIENGADRPARRSFNDYEPSIFQVALRLTLPSRITDRFNWIVWNRHIVSRTGSPTLQWA